MFGIIGVFNDFRKNHGVSWKGVKSPLSSVIWESKLIESLGFSGYCLKIPRDFCRLDSLKSKLIESLGFLDILEIPLLWFQETPWFLQARFCSLLFIANFNKEKQRKARAPITWCSILFAIFAGFQCPLDYRPSVWFQLLGLPSWLFGL